MKIKTILEISSKIYMYLILSSISTSPRLTPYDIPFLKNERGRNKTKQNFAKVGTFQKSPVLRVDVTKHGKTEEVLTNEGGTLDQLDYLDLHTAAKCVHVETNENTLQILAQNQHLLN
jgi:hypothetical protein